MVTGMPLVLHLIYERGQCILNPILFDGNHHTRYLLTKAASWQLPQVTETKPEPVIVGVCVFGGGGRDKNPGAGSAWEGSWTLSSLSLACGKQLDALV